MDKQLTVGTVQSLNHQLTQYKARYSVGNREIRKRVDYFFSKAYAMNEFAVPPRPEEIVLAGKEARELGQIVLDHNLVDTVVGDDDINKAIAQLTASLSVGQIDMSEGAYDMDMVVEMYFKVLQDADPKDVHRAVNEFVSGKHGEWMPKCAKFASVVEDKKRERKATVCKLERALGKKP